MRAQEEVNNMGALGKLQHYLIGSGFEASATAMDQISRDLGVNISWNSWRNGLSQDEEKMLEPVLGKINELETSAGRSFENVAAEGWNRIQGGNWQQHTTDLKKKLTEGGAGYNWYDYMKSQGIQNVPTPVYKTAAEIAADEKALGKTPTQNQPVTPKAPTGNVSGTSTQSQTPSATYQPMQVRRIATADELKYLPAGEKYITKQIDPSEVEAYKTQGYQVANMGQVFPDLPVTVAPVDKPAAGSSTASPVAPPGPTQAPASGAVHTVVRGDSLSAIAKKYGTTVDELMMVNPDIKNRNLIYPNQKIVIPEVKSAASIQDVINGAQKSLKEKLDSAKSGSGNDFTRATAADSSTENAEKVAPKRKTLVERYTEFFGGQEVKDLKNKVTEIDKEIKEIEIQEQKMEDDIRKEVSGEATEGYITALASQRNRDLYYKKAELLAEKESFQTQLTTQQEQAKIMFELSLKDEEMALENLKNYTEMGIRLDKDSLNQIDDTLGIPGFSAQYVAAAEKAKKAKTEKEDIELMASIIDLQTKLPKGKSFEINGKVYESISAPGSDLDLENKRLQNEKLRMELGLVSYGNAGATADLNTFMMALSGQESGGDYNAQNARTSAFGKFQIMPQNWQPWAKEAGLPTGTPQTPENQELVAQYKMKQYYQKYGNWADVASVWYSGKPFAQVEAEGWADRPQGNGDEPSVREYVNQVLARLPKTTTPLKQEDKVKLNKEVAESGAYKALLSAAKSKELLDNYEEIFKRVGNQRFGADATELRSAYRKAILDLKEVFNLGVLNGPDLVLMESILVNPAVNALLDPIKFKEIGGEAGMQKSIDETRKMLDSHIKARHEDLMTAYGEYDKSQLTNLQNADRAYQKLIGATQEGEILVKSKVTGQTGTIPENEFNPNLYEKI